MPFFKKVFKSKDARAAAKDRNDLPAAAPKKHWAEAWSRKTVDPEELQELIHGCTQELKARALDTPFILLPFRPSSDPSATRNFVRNFFKSAYEGTRQFEGEALTQELRLAEPLTLCSILKWCWSRLPGGVVSWDAYELFRIGESDSNFARHAFDTFIPLSVDSEARKQIIFDFFDLLAATAAHSKNNGMGGRKLSRMAGWWAFEFIDDGKGFDGGYRTWTKAADAASHLFFAYLRSLAPDPDTVVGGISKLPRSLQSLLAQTEYPPQTPLLMQVTTTKVVMIVDSVSPTPFALLRRAKNFEYRDDDEALQAFSSYDDTVNALTDECRRVLAKISSANQSTVAPSASTNDPTWSRFEDFGFSGILETPSSANGPADANGLRDFSAMRSGPHSRTTNLGRPTTPSWADFLSTGFPDENGPSSTLLSPSAKLPPIGEAARVRSSQSHLRNGLQVEEDLEPGELASITRFDLDDTFWWVWMTSLASEETTERKAAFGRCTLIETKISGAKWLVVEEQVKGAATGPEEGAYIAEKKSMFSWTKRGRLGRSKSTGKKPTKEPYSTTTSNTPMSKTSIGPDQQARVQAAAAQLAQSQRDKKAAEELAVRRGRMDDAMSTKTNSVLTLQPHLLSAAGPAIKWDKKFGEGAKDKNALRAQYLGDVNAGKGSRDNLLNVANGTSSAMSNNHSTRDLPALPPSEYDAQSAKSHPLSPSPMSPSADAEHYPVGSSSAGRANRSPLSPSALDEKPGLGQDVMEQHPALRKPASESAPAQPEVRSSVDQPSSTIPESKKSAPKKLKKEKEKSGGFRKLFGRKKNAATGATQEDPRSVSRVDDHDDTPARQPSPSFSLERPPPIRAASPDAVSAISATYNESALQVVPTPTKSEEHEAGQAFDRFDQGPMEEMPAFVPEDSDSDLAAPNVPRTPEATSGQSRAHMDDVSEESVDLGLQQVPSQDRWAQIRKNAADRAARLSEEQRRRSISQSQSARTDEGETSGEETIESRVARIKARVAELTGNMDGQPTAGVTR